MVVLIGGPMPFARGEMALGATAAECASVSTSPAGLSQSPTSSGSGSGRGPSGGSLLKTSVSMRM